MYSVEQGRDFIKFDGIRLFDLPFVNQVRSDIYQRFPSPKKGKVVDTIIHMLPSLKMSIKRSEEALPIEPFIRMEPTEIVLFHAPIAAGKTTILMRTAIDFAKNRNVLFVTPNNIPVFVNLLQQVKVKNLYVAHSLDVLTPEKLKGMDCIFIDSMDEFAVSAPLGIDELEGRFGRSQIYQAVLLKLAHYVRSKKIAALISVSERRHMLLPPLALGEDAEGSIDTSSINVPLSFKYIADRIYTMRNNKLYVIKDRRRE